MKKNILFYFLLMLPVTNILSKDDLFRAIDQEDLKEIEKILEKSKKNGTLKKDLSDYSPQGFTPLTAAISEEREQAAILLIKYGADVNQANLATGYTPLIIASAQGNENLIQLLIKNYAYVYKADKEGKTPLMHAANNSRTEAILLLANANSSINTQDIYGCNALMLALMADDFDLETITTLLNLNINIDQIDNFGTTALMYAIKDTENNINTVPILLKYNPSLDIQNNNGSTALMKAVKKNAPAIVKLLRCAGAETQLRNNNNETALDIAQNKGFIDIVQILNDQIDKKEKSCD